MKYVINARKSMFYPIGRCDTLDEVKEKLKEKSNFTLLQRLSYITSKMRQPID